MLLTSSLILRGRQGRQNWFLPTPMNLHIVSSSSEQIVVGARRLVNGDPLVAVLKSDGRVYRGEYSSAELKPVVDHG